MTPRITASVVLLILAMASGSDALAKADTVRLTVYDAKHGVPIELTQPEVIAANVFAGNFADWKRDAEAPDRMLPRYTIEFHVLPPRTTASRMMYVVTFVWDPAQEQGFVYLPGPGERWYNLNIGTIDRAGKDGAWRYADAQWSRVIRDSLAAAQHAVR